MNTNDLDWQDWTDNPDTADSFELIGFEHSAYEGEGKVLRTYVDAHDAVIDIVEYEHDCIIAICEDSEYHVSVDEIEALAV